MLKKLFIIFIFCFSITIQCNNAMSNEILLEACYFGDIKTVDNLLKTGVNVNYKSFKNGMTPLMYASAEGHINVVRLLLQNKARVNAQDFDGWTALMYACQKKGYIDIVKLLIQYNADIHIEDNKTWTAFTSANLFGHKDIMEVLVNVMRIEQKIKNGN